MGDLIQLRPKQTEAQRNVGKLDVQPTLKSAVFDVLDFVIRQDSSSKEELEEAELALNDVYKQMSSLYSKLNMKLYELEEKGAISNRDGFCTFVCVASADHLRMEHLDNIDMLLMKDEFDFDKFVDAVNNSALSTSIKNYLTEIANKIKQHEK